MLAYPFQLKNPLEKHKPVVEHCQTNGPLHYATCQDYDKCRRFWGACLPHLIELHGHYCHYFGMYYDNLEVDHFLPKALPQFAGQAFDWHNFRLIYRNANSRKLNHLDVMDPFETQPGWFKLNLRNADVIVGDNVPADKVELVQSTIVRLKLNSPNPKNKREEALKDYFKRTFKWNYLVRKYIYLAFEVERQGQRLPFDD
jgi:hypothetical protein